MTSPLEEALPQSLDELFSRDPLDLQDQDIVTIVCALRAARERWNVAESNGAKRAPKASAPVNIDLKDLGL